MEALQLSVYFRMDLGAEFTMFSMAMRHDHTMVSSNTGFWSDISVR